MITESFEFHKRLLYAEPVTISMPPNLYLCRLEIEFPDGLFEQVTRDTRMGARRMYDVEHTVEFNVFNQSDCWRFKKRETVSRAKRDKFSVFVELKYRGAHYMPPTSIRITRDTEDGENAYLRRMSVLKGMTVKYEPITKTAITKAAPKADLSESQP